MFPLLCFTAFCAALLVGALVLNPASKAVPDTAPLEETLESPLPVPAAELLPLAPSPGALAPEALAGDSVVDDIAQRYREFWEAHPC